MKTEYQILWVDDQLDTIENDKDTIEDFLAERGITTNFMMFESDGTDSIHEEVKGAVNEPELDLIVVDYSMATEGDDNGMNGETLIDLIRTSDHVYLPVVFYSSYYEDLLAAVATAKLDGVYLAQRDRVSQKLEMVITSLLRKEQTTKRTRGLLMEGVSEIDANLGALLMKIWNKLSEEQRVGLHAYFEKKTAESVKRSEKNASAYPAFADFANHMATKFVSPAYETMTRWKVLKRGLELVGFDDEKRSTFDELFDRQDDQPPLARLRNKYAHLSRAKLEEIHDEQMCISIRNELRRQFNNFAHILDNV